jgi:hypothetical protein
MAIQRFRATLEADDESAFMYRIPFDAKGFGRTRRCG